MKLVVDTHTHTYASGHAYSTLLENAAAAKEAGLSMFCTTDHTDSMPGAPHFWFFHNQRILPRYLKGVVLLKGAEVNILNASGDIDLPPQVDEALDWIIASFHEVVFTPSSELDHTNALINVIKSGRVDALGHLGNPNYPFDFKAVLDCAKQYNVAIEINNSSLVGNSRLGSVERCYEIAKQAKENGNLITTGTDSHFCQQIGNFKEVNELLEAVEIDPAMVITHTESQFLGFLALRGRTLDGLNVS